MNITQEGEQSMELSYAIARYEQALELLPTTLPQGLREVRPVRGKYLSAMICQGLWSRSLIWSSCATW